MSKILLWAFALVMTGLLNSFMWAQGVNAEPAKVYALPDAPSAINANADDPIPASAIRSGDHDASGELVPGADPDNHLMLPFIDHLVEDQKTFWTAPLHFHK